MPTRRQATSVTDAPGPPPALNRLLGRVERQMGRLLEAPLAGEGLTLDQWRVLDVLAHEGGRTMSELAAAVVVPGPTLTKIADKLVDMGLVHRLVDERDRRRVLAFLSERGTEVHAGIAEQVRSTEAEVLARLAGDGDTLVGLLTRLAEAGEPEDRRAR